MKAAKTKKQSSRNSRKDLSHTLEAKNPNKLTIIQLNANIQQQKSIYYNSGAGKLVKLKKSWDTTAVFRESTKSHPRKLQDQNNRPAF